MIRKKRRKAVDYSDPKERKEVLVRQRRGMWTPEQIASFVRHFKLKPGLKLLDAGCGYGYSLRTFGYYCMPRGMLVGIDIEEKLLATARNYSRRERLGKASSFAKADVYSLPFPKNTFDITIAHVLLCHLVDPERAFDELIRVTRRNGCIAIFDNAVEGGGYYGWSNLYTPSIKQKLVEYEMSLRMIRGKKRSGKGDFSVACYIPGWMEKRGLKNVNARCNERITWIAPPYKSPAQRTALRNIKERLKEGTLDTKSAAFKEYIDRLRVGGADENMIKDSIRRSARRDKKWRKAMRSKKVAFAQSSGGFWCVWGFKP